MKLREVFSQVVWVIGGVALANGVIDLFKGDPSGVISLTLFIGIALGGVAGILQD